MLVHKRKELRLSQRQLSDKSDVGTVQICMYEKGKVIPTKRIMEKITKALNLPTDFFDPYIRNVHEAPSDDVLRNELDQFMQLDPDDTDKTLLFTMIKRLRLNYNNAKPTN